MIRNESESSVKANQTAPGSAGNDCDGIVAGRRGRRAIRAPNGRVGGGGHIVRDNPFAGIISRRRASCRDRRRVGRSARSTRAVDGLSVRDLSNGTKTPPINEESKIEKGLNDNGGCVASTSQEASAVAKPKVQRPIQPCKAVDTNGDNTTLNAKRPRGRPRLTGAAMTKVRRGRKTGITMHSNDAVCVASTSQEASTVAKPKVQRPIQPCKAVDTNADNTTLNAHTSLGIYIKPGIKAKRPRGRPRRTADGTYQIPVIKLKRPRGRPRRTADGTYQIPVIKLKRPVGRPRRTADGTYQIPVIKLKRPRGRPRRRADGTYQIPVIKLKRPVGRPRRRADGTYQIPVIKLKRPVGRPRKIPRPLPQAKATTIEVSSGTLYETCPTTKAEPIVQLKCRICDKERSGKYYSLFGEPANESKSESFGNGTEFALKRSCSRDLQVLVTSNSLIFKKKKRTECIDMKNILKVMNRLNLEIKKDDGMPQNICELCVKRFFVLYSFVRRGIQIQQDVRQKLNKPPLCACQAESSVAIKEANSFVSSSVEPPCSVIEKADNSQTGLNNASVLTSTLPLPLVSKGALKHFSPIVTDTISSDSNQQVLQQAPAKRKRGRPPKKKRNNNKGAYITGDNDIAQFQKALSGSIKPKNIVDKIFAKTYSLRSKDSDENSETRDVISESIMQMEPMDVDESESTTLNLHETPRTSRNAVKRRRLDFSEGICEKQPILQEHTDEMLDEKNYGANISEINETVNSNLLIEEQSKSSHEPKRCTKRKTKYTGENTFKKRLCFEEPNSVVDRQLNSTNPTVPMSTGNFEKEHETNIEIVSSLKSITTALTADCNLTLIQEQTAEPAKIKALQKEQQKRSFGQMDENVEDYAKVHMESKQVQQEQLKSQELKTTDDTLNSSNTVPVPMSTGNFEKGHESNIEIVSSLKSITTALTADCNLTLIQEQTAEPAKIKALQQEQQKRSFGQMDENVEDYAKVHKESKQVQQEQLKSQELKTTDDTLNSSNTVPVPMSTGNFEKGHESNIEIVSSLKSITTALTADCNLTLIQEQTAEPAKIKALQQEQQKRSFGQMDENVEDYAKVHKESKQVQQEQLKSQELKTTDDTLNSSNTVPVPMSTGNFEKGHESNIEIVSSLKSITTALTADCNLTLIQEQTAEPAKIKALQQEQQKRSFGQMDENVEDYAKVHKESKQVQQEQLKSQELKTTDDTLNSSNTVPVPMSTGNFEKGHESNIEIVSSLKSITTALTADCNLTLIQEQTAEPAKIKALQQEQQKRSFGQMDENVEDYAKVHMESQQVQQEQLKSQELKTTDDTLNSSNTVPVPMSTGNFEKGHESNIGIVSSLKSITTALTADCNLTLIQEQTAEPAKIKALQQEQQKRSFGQMDENVEDYAKVHKESKQVQQEQLKSQELKTTDDTLNSSNTVPVPMSTGNFEKGHESKIEIVSSLKSITTALTADCNLTLIQEQTAEPAKIKALQQEQQKRSFGQMDENVEDYAKVHKESKQVQQEQLKSQELKTTDDTLNSSNTVPVPMSTGNFEKAHENNIEIVSSLKSITTALTADCNLTLIQEQTAEPAKIKALQQEQQKRSFGQMDENVEDYAKVHKESKQVQQEQLKSQELKTTDDTLNSSNTVPVPMSTGNFEKGHESNIEIVSSLKSITTALTADCSQLPRTFSLNTDFESNLNFSDLTLIQEQTAEPAKIKALQQEQQKRSFGQMDENVEDYAKVHKESKQVQQEQLKSQELKTTDDTLNSSNTVPVPMSTGNFEKGHESNIEIVSSLKSITTALTADCNLTLIQEQTVEPAKIKALQQEQQKGSFGQMDENVEDYAKVHMESKQVQQEQLKSQELKTTDDTLNSSSTVPVPMSTGNFEKGHESNIGIVSSLKSITTALTADCNLTLIQEQTVEPAKIKALQQEQQKRSFGQMDENVEDYAKVHMESKQVQQEQLKSQELKTTDDTLNSSNTVPVPMSTGNFEKAHENNIEIVSSLKSITTALTADCNLTLIQEQTVEPAKIKALQQEQQKRSFGQMDENVEDYEKVHMESKQVQQEQLKSQELKTTDDTLNSSNTVPVPMSTGNFEKGHESNIGIVSSLKSITTALTADCNLTLIQEQTVEPAKIKALQQEQQKRSFGQMDENVEDYAEVHMESKQVQQEQLKSQELKTTDDTLNSSNTVPVPMSTGNFEKGHESNIEIVSSLKSITTALTADCNLTLIQEQTVEPAKIKALQQEQQKRSFGQMDENKRTDLDLILPQFSIKSPRKQNEPKETIMETKCPKIQQFAEVGYNEKEKTYLPNWDHWFIDEEEVTTTTDCTTLENRESFEKELGFQASSKKQEYEEKTFQLLQSAAISDDLQNDQELNTPNTIESAGDKNIFEFMGSLTINNEFAMEKQPQKLLEATKSGRTDGTLESLNNFQFFTDLNTQDLYKSLDNFHFPVEAGDQVQQSKEQKSTATGRDDEPFENTELQVQLESQQHQEFNALKIEKTDEVISPFFVEQKKANSQRFKETEKALHMQPQIDQETILYTEADMQEKHQKVPNIIHCKDMNDHKVKEPSQYEMLIQSLDTHLDLLEKSGTRIKQNVVQATDCPKSTLQEKQYSNLENLLFSPIKPLVVTRPEEEDMFIQSFDHSLFNEKLENRDQQEQQKIIQNSLYLNEQQPQTEYNSVLSNVESSPDCNQQKHQLGHVSPNFDCASLELLPPTQVSPTLRNYTADTTPNTIDTKTPRTLPNLTTAMKSDDEAQSPGVSNNIAMRSRSSTMSEIESLTDNSSVWSPSKSRVNSENESLSDSSSDWSPPKSFLKRVAAISKMTTADKVKLHCRYCDKSVKFTNNMDNTGYVIDMPSEGAPFNCPYCPILFLKHSNGQDSVRKEHATRRIQCAHCNQDFDTPHSLDLHLQKVHAVDILSAQKTQPTTQGQEANNNHVQMMVRSKQVLSKHCSVVKPPMTAPAEAQQAHCTRVQPSEIVTDQRAVPSPQTEPDSTTSSTTTLRQFRRRRTPPKPINSPCTISFPSSPTICSPSQSLLADATIQQRPQFTTTHGRYDCLICEKRYTNAKAQHKHHQTAHIEKNEMPYMCSICGRGFRLRTTLDRHMETHDAAGRPYECDQCLVRFPLLSQLSLHKITAHMTQRTFMCEQCGDQLITERALMDHICTHEMLN